MKVLICVGVVGLLFLALFVPVFPAHNAIYNCAGTPPSEYQERVSAPVNEKRYVIRNGKVYVLEMLQWQAVLLVTRGKFVEWSPAELDELRSKNPELQDPLLWE